MASTASTGPGSTRSGRGRTPPSASVSRTAGRRSGLSGGSPKADPAGEARRASRVPHFRFLQRTVPVWWAHYVPGGRSGRARAPPDVGVRPDAGPAGRGPSGRNGARGLFRPQVEHCTTKGAQNTSNSKNGRLEIPGITRNTSCEAWYLSQREKGGLENRNQRGCQSVNKRGSSSWPSSYRGQGQAGGNRWGAGVIRAISRVERRLRPHRAHDEGEGA
jgi:hypothetical protein